MTAKPADMLRPAVWATITLAVWLSLLSTCIHPSLFSDGDGHTKLSPLERIRKRGELIVLTRNAPTTYFLDKDGKKQGFEYELARAFARELGVKPRFVIMDSIAEILAAISRGEGDIAAAGLTRTPEREKQFAFGPDYMTVQQQVVCRRDRWIPRKVSQLADLDLVVIDKSSYLEQLEKRRQQVPQLQWQVTQEEETEQLMLQVWERTIYATIADSNIVAVNRRYLPELEVAFNISDDQPLAWVINPELSKQRHLLDLWFEEKEQTGFLGDLREKYYGYVEDYNYVNVRTFLRRVESRLPKYRPHFEAAAEKTAFEWSLIAAQAYQESHWNPKAVSRTGVRGLMMLTRPTAKQMGLKNRMDPKGSIHAGARYLKGLHDRLPEEIVEPDRTWLALAAYNVGYGHLMDARKLAVQLKKDPNRWADMSEVLPLLAHRRYYKKLKYGYARGYEPVRYVTQIRDYHDLLVRKMNGSLLIQQARKQ